MYNFHLLLVKINLVHKHTKKPYPSLTGEPLKESRSYKFRTYSLYFFSSLRRIKLISFSPVILIKPKILLNLINISLRISEEINSKDDDSIRYVFYT